MTEIPAAGLLISLSNLGDAIMTTPVLEALHEHDPELRIDIVADRRSHAVFQHCPYRGEILLRDKRAGWRGSLDLLRTLRRRRYRCAVDLRTDGLTWLLRARAHFSKPRRPPSGHSVERHFAVIRPLVGAVRIPATTVWLPQALRAAARARIRGEGRTLALGPGANWIGKTWAVANFAALGTELRTDFDRIVLLGNAQDAARADDLAARLPGPVLNLAGKTDILEAAAVLAIADLFVGNDSGLGHLAAAVDTPVVTVFGPGEPDRYRPWGRNCEVLVGADQRIDTVAPAAVAHAVRRLLADRGTPR